MKEINSSHNETFKSLKQLATSPKHRRRSNQTLLEGIHLCESYLATKELPLMLVHTQKALENAEVLKIATATAKAGVPGILLDENNFKAISSVENGIGILFVVNIPALQVSKDLQATALLLEDIQDPGNMGAILRTAAAAGITDVFTSGNSASVWSPKVLRAGMGAHFALTVYENCDLEQLIADSVIPVLATSLQATETIYEKDLSRPTAWLFGNEGQGVSEALLASSIEQVIIPQNSKVESLNVAASVAVCLFEQSRQRTLAGSKG